MTGISQQFCVRWNSHLGSLGAAFPQLLAGQQFVDVTLACDGHQVHCHRLVLAACSSYFESLLSENPCKHPIIILPKDIKLWEIHALVDFMYKGQVNVSQAGLPQLLKCAETLQIRGLCGTDSTLNEVANGKIDRCIDPSVLSTTTNCSPNFNFSSMFASNLMQTNYQSDDEPPSSSTFRQQHSDLLTQRTPNNTSTFATELNATKTVNHRKMDNLVKTKAHTNAHNDKQTKELNNATLSTTTKNSLKHLSENEASNTGSSELNIKCEEIDSDANAADDGMDDELDEHSNSKQSDDTMQLNDDDAVVDNDLHLVCDDMNEIEAIDGTEMGQIESNAHLFDCAAAEHSISITKTESIDDAQFCYSPSWSMAAETNERYSQDDIDCDVIPTSPPTLPTSLKFNRNTMSISVKRTPVKCDAGRQKRRHHQQSSSFIRDDNEHVICSPQIASNDSNDFVPNETLQNHFGHGNSTGSKLYAIGDDDDGDNNGNENVDGDENNDDNGNCSIGNGRNTFKAAKNRQNDRLMELIGYTKDPLKSAVVLRSPRGNQPRTYTTDALYTALMAVKSGESIYRASQIHGVPRKTLRNWMKRWHIKSVYPMPYQLKKAAEKKRQNVQQNNETQSSTAPCADLSEIETIEY